MATTTTSERKIQAEQANEELRAQSGFSAETAYDTAKELGWRPAESSGRGNTPNPLIMERDGVRLNFWWDVAEDDWAGFDDEPTTVQCAYCNASVEYDDEPVPAVDDDDEWNRRAVEHTTDCEWIATRAHRVNYF
jgi:hypothetical protein